MKSKLEFPQLPFLLLSLPVSPFESLICICIHVCDPDFIVCLFTRALSPTSPPLLPSLPLIWQPVGLLPALNTAFPGYSSSVISTLSPY